jgi:TRAP-type uncharacterized transport system fused permease subunit
MGLLMQGSLVDILLATATAAIAVAALAAGFGGWILGPASVPERALAIAAGLLLSYAGSLADLGGLLLLAAAVGVHLVTRRGARAPAAAYQGDGRSV